MPRAQSTENRFAPVLTYLGAASNEQRAYLCGSAHVRTTAWLQIGAFNLDRAQNSGAIHFLAHTHLRELFRSAVAHVDRPVFEDDAIRGAFCAFEDFRCRLGATEINRTQLGAEMK